MKILILAGLLLGAPQEDDPARWVAFLTSQRAVDRDEAFIRLLKLGDKAAAALKGSTDIRAKDVLALIEGRQDKLLEILARAKEEAGASMERLLWRAHQICAALCDDRDWPALKAVLAKGKCVDDGIIRGQWGDTARYVILLPAWASKSGAEFDMYMSFEVDPEPSPDEATRIFVRGTQVSLHLRSPAKAATLLGGEGFTQDSVLRAAISQDMKEAVASDYSMLNSVHLDYASSRHDDSMLNWSFRIRLRQSSEEGEKWVHRDFDATHGQGEVKSVVATHEYSGEGRGGSQGSVQRLDPPEVEEVTELKRLKPPDCATAYGPGDFKTLSETLRGLVIYGEGILQRDFDRIARFRNLTYLALDNWKSGRRVRLNVLKQLPDLEALELHNLFHSDVEHVLTLKRLKALDILDCSRLTEDDFVRIAELPSLIALDLNDCSSISDRALRALAARKQLRQLDFAGRGAPVTDEGLREVGKLTELNRLSICYAKALTAEGFEHLAGLKNLRELIVGYAGVDDRVMAVFGRIKSLQEVWIYGGDAVTDEGLMHMSSLPDLDYMNVESKTTTKKGWEALRAKLPGKWR